MHPGTGGGPHGANRTGTSGGGWRSPGSIDLRELARALPSGLGYVASRKKWRTAPHLNLLTRRLLDLEQRRITRLIVEMPPRHGKSELCSQYFPAWYLGRHPDARIMLASYEATFAASWGEKTKIVLKEFGRELFGVDLHPKWSAKASDWRLANNAGRMMCAGVAGGFTGRGADLLIFDDPIRNAQEAMSVAYRNRVWDFYLSTAQTRLEPGGLVVIIMTRWNQDDLVGRLLKQQDMDPYADQWTRLTLPALCEGPGDALHRAIGEALWPWRYTREALLKIKGNTSALWWNALYQQRPTPPGGALAKTTWFQIMHALPDWPMRKCRYWDCAGSSGEKGGDPDWTVGTLMARDGGTFYIEDVKRVRLTSGDVDRLIRQTAAVDGPEVMIREEQEPGSSGLAVINTRKTALAGYDYRGVGSSGAKEVRWQPMLVQAEVGNVKLLAGPWNGIWLAEASDAPYGVHDDQLDSAAGAFNALALEMPMASLDDGAEIPLYF